MRTIEEALRQKSKNLLEKLSDVEVDELASEIDDALYAEDVYGQVMLSFDNKESILKLYIHVDGDWKHDHELCDEIIEKFCKEHDLTILSAKQVIISNDDTDADSYEAEHQWELKNTKSNDFGIKEAKEFGRGEYKITPPGLYGSVEKNQAVRDRFNADAQAEPYFIVELSSSYDPEGLYVNGGKDKKIVLAGTLEECQEYLDKIKAQAHATADREKNSYRHSVYIEKEGDDFIQIYYPNAVARATYQLIKNDKVTEDLVNEENLDKENVKEGWVTYYRPEDGDRVRFIKANDSPFLPEDEKELQKEYVGKIATITYVGSQFVSNDRVGLRFDDGKKFDCSSWQIEPLQKRPKVTEELVNEENLEETYSDDELDKMVGKVYNIRKLTDWHRNEDGLMADTICTKCGRTKQVFLSNLVNDPEKYGSCICSDENIDSRIDYAKELYTGGRKLSSNTSGYTGVSFVKTYKGQPYNKWRAYIEVDGKRTYLGDFEKKKDAIKARKEAGEKGVKWYKDNRNQLMRDMRRKSKKYKNSKYRDSKRKTVNIKKDK